MSDESSPATESAVQQEPTQTETTTLNKTADTSATATATAAAQQTSSVRRNGRRAVRSIYATREPATAESVDADASLPSLSSPSPATAATTAAAAIITPKRSRVRKTESQTSFDQASVSSSTVSSPRPVAIVVPPSPSLVDTTMSTPPNSKPTASSSLLKYKTGMLVEARDSVKEWYKAKVIEIDEAQMRVKVHFLGWNSRFDQWFEAKSSDIKPIKTTNASGKMTSDEVTFEPGTKVMAKWKDEFYYAAYVIRQVERDDQRPDAKFYEIRYTDKVRKVLRAENLRLPTQEELALAFQISTPPPPPPPPAANTTNNTNANHSTNNTSLAPVSNSSQIGPSSDAGETTSDNQRRADAELLLAMHQSETAAVESKANESNDGGVAGEGVRVGDVSMNPPASIPPLPEVASAIASSAADQQPPLPQTPTTPTPSLLDSNRKSLRVKRLRTYTEEIVFDSPSASIAYNLASVHKQVSVSSSTDLGASFSSTSAKKRRGSGSIAEKESVASARAGASTSEASRKSQKMRNYLQSLKLFKSGVSQKMPVKTKQAKTKHVEEKRKEGGGKKEGSKKQRKKQQQLVESDADKKLKKKKKRDKKKLFEQLIETSKKQLQHQQELIEKQLQRHEHKKSQKRLQKLLRRQQKRLQQQQQQQQSTLYPNSFFFPTGCSNDLILNQLMHMQAIMFNQTQSGIMTEQIPNLTAGFSQQQQQQQREQEPPPLPSRDKISSEPIACTVENCTKTFRKQSLLDYHLKYHHYINNPTTSTTTASPNASFLASASTDEPMSTVPAAKKRRLSASLNHKSSRKRSFLKLTSLSSSLNLNRTTSTMTGVAATVDENVDVVDVDDSDDVFIGDLVGFSDSSDGGSGAGGGGGGDPYEVIHCKCGSHSSVGFMIQCDTCLCWQHGDCVGLKKGNPVPSNYACWVCSQPENKLKSLKYKNWSSSRLEKEIMRRLERLGAGEDGEEAANENADEIEHDEYNKLCLLNDFSRRFYNLNLLMYTHEYQLSLFNRILHTLNKINSATTGSGHASAAGAASASTSGSVMRRDEPVQTQPSSPPTVPGIEYDEQTFDMLEKLAHNIQHLKSCIDKKFEQFNSKLDEFENKYPQDARSTSMANSDLEKLYKQFQASTRAATKVN